MTTKHERIKQLIDKHGLDGLLIQQVSNFAWATDGAASYINTAATNGVAALVITSEERHIIADNIETPRLELEEQLAAQGWQFHSHRWDQPSDDIARLTAGLKLGADGSYPGAVDLSGELAITRSYLDSNEQDRFRSLSMLCADSMDEAIREVEPGMTEHQIAGLLAGVTMARGVLPTVILVAADDRIYNFRHPLPTEKKLDKYAMLVLCGRKDGLVSSLTRLVHFGALPDDLRRKTEAVAYVDGAMIAATRPGVRIKHVFQAAKSAYRQVGFEDEWQLHHQGGPSGYDPREFIATEVVDLPVAEGQVYAWNPSITVCKSEDTILVGADQNEILTAMAGWPAVPVGIEDQVIERPVVLVVD